jgi:uncharacterized oligopeptide transporter (OPT) family protein
MPTVSPAYLGVGYIIGPQLAALNFAGSVIAWGLLVPVILLVIGPNVAQYVPQATVDENWLGTANAVWRFIVRPIAVGTMMVGAAVLRGASSRLTGRDFRTSGRMAVFTRANGGTPSVASTVT